jgi:hypothetical protein
VFQVESPHSYFVSGTGDDRSMYLMSKHGQEGGDGGTGTEEGDWGGGGGAPVKAPRLHPPPLTHRDKPPTIHSSSLPSSSQSDASHHTDQSADRDTSRHTQDYFSVSQAPPGGGGGEQASGQGQTTAYSDSGVSAVAGSSRGGGSDSVSVSSKSFPVYDSPRTAGLDSSAGTSMRPGT